MGLENFKICKRCGFVVPISQNRNNCPVCNSAELEDMKKDERPTKNSSIPPPKKTSDNIPKDNKTPTQTQIKKDTTKLPITEKNKKTGKTGKRRLFTLFKPFFTTDKFDSTLGSNRNLPNNVPPPSP